MSLALAFSFLRRRRPARLILIVDGKCLLDVPTDQLALLAEYGGGEWNALEQLGVGMTGSIEIAQPCVIDLLVRSV